VLRRGKQVYVDGRPLFEHEYSDALLSQLLKTNDPERFKDRFENKSLMVLDLSKMTPEQLDILAQHLIKQATGGDEAAAAKARTELEAKVNAIEGAVEPAAEPEEQPSARVVRRPE
jgi:hypothetical protein